MQPYQQRVVDEKAELDIKITALNKFIPTQNFSSLDSDNRTLLVAQLNAMLEYSDILTDRISLFNKESN